MPNDNEDKVLRIKERKDFNITTLLLMYTHHAPIISLAKPGSSELSINYSTIPHGYL